MRTNIGIGKVGFRNILPKLASSSTCFNSHLAPPPPFFFLLFLVYETSPFILRRSPGSASIQYSSEPTFHSSVYRGTSFRVTAHQRTVVTSCGLVSLISPWKYSQHYAPPASPVSSNVLKNFQSCL